MKLLFVCENPHEAQSQIPIAKALSRKNACLNARFTSLDSFLFQQTNELFAAAGVRWFQLPVATGLDRPLSQYSTLRRMRVLLKSAPALRHLVDDFDAVLCGVDTPITRILLFEAQKQHKPTFQVVNAFILASDIAQSQRGRLTAGPLTAAMKDTAKRFAAVICRADFLRPRPVGHSRCDRIFVMGQRVKQILTESGVEKQRIVVTGVPRFANLFERTTPPPARGDFRIFYATGAYLWHGKARMHRQQQQQLQMLIELVAYLGPRYKLVLKVHPREQQHDYDWLLGRKQVEIHSQQCDIYNLIENSHLTLSIGSTILFEAVVMKRPSVALLFPDKRLAFNLFEQGKELETADDVARLRELIIEISTDKDRYDRLIEKESSVLSHYIDPDTPASAEKIADRIAAVVGLDTTKTKGEMCGSGACLEFVVRRQSEI